MRAQVLLAVTAGSALILTAPRSHADDPSPAVELDEIVITSRAEKLYRVEETSVGKLATLPLESSQSVQAINAELIADQGARTAQDLYRNLSGVTFFSYAGVTARGFRQEEIFFDGLRGDPYAGFTVPDLFNIERVEFLKGPAGMLYGQTAPGGLFNYVTKVPGDSFGARARVIAGSEARRGASLETSGPLPVDNVAGRIGLFYEDRDQPRYNAASESLIADGSLAYDLGSSRLVLQATRYDIDLQGNRLRGVPTDDAGNFLTTRRWNHNEASDFLRLESDAIQARLEGALGDSVSYDLAARYNDAVESQQYHEPFGLFDSDADGNVDASRRQFRDQVRAQDSWSMGANLRWSTQLGSVPTRILAGADLYDFDLVFDGRSVSGGTTVEAGRPTPLSLVTPEYGVTDPDAYLLPAFSRTVSASQRIGGYLLNESTFGPVIATLGARFDRFEDVSQANRFEDEAVSWRAGLVYRLRPDTSAFLQWATSFEPQSVGSQTPDAGGPFDPTEGEMIEGGLKFELAGGRMQASAVAYRIERTNILQADPRGDVGGDGVNDLVAYGEVTSQGFEWDLVTDLTPNWVLTLAYGYNETEITRSNALTTITNSVGDRFANAPRNQAGFWTRYQFAGTGLALALGGDYVDVRRSLSNQVVQAYFVMDASLIWDRGPWSVLLRINNLADETYAASGFIDRTGHFPGAPREAFLEVSRHW